MNLHNHGVFFAGIEVVGINKPALHPASVALPGNAFGFSPVWLLALIGFSHLFHSPILPAQTSGATAHVLRIAALVIPSLASAKFG